MKRYKELKFGDSTYTETYKINDILIKNGFDWFLDCEVENVRIEISKNTLIFNSGVFFNGTWQYGVFRDGQWKYGTWEGGVWYNGTWYNGIFKNGLIFDGRFISGKIEGGEIRGGEFFNVEIGKTVYKNIAQENKNSPKPQQGQPKNRGEFQKVNGQTQPIDQPIQDIQPEKIEERFIKTYEGFFQEIFNTTKDDKIGNKILKYIENNTNNILVNLNVVKNHDAPIKVFSFSITNNEIGIIDPNGEENWNNDNIVIKSYAIHMPRKYNPNPISNTVEGRVRIKMKSVVLLNNDRLRLNSKLSSEIYKKMIELYTK